MELINQNPLNLLVERALKTSMPRIKFATSLILRGEDGTSYWSK